MGVEVFPNPEYDYLNIRMNTPKPLQLQLIDLSGNVVLLQEINDSASLDIRHLPRGICLGELSNGWNRLVIKIIKD